MDFTIRVLGDISYLAEVIRASSAIMSFADFKTLIAIGFLLGILWIVVQGINSGGKEIKVGQIMVAGLMYAAFFGITVDGVRIQQERTVMGGGGDILMPSRIEIVDDVPIGLAATGMVISSVGSAISDWFRSEFTRPAANGIDPLFALEMLMRMKDVGFDNSIVNWDQDGLIQANVDRYFQSCTMIGLTLQDGSGRVPIQKDHILKAGMAGYPPTVWDAIRFNNNLYRTRIVYKDDSDEEVTENLGCAEAHTKLTAKLFNEAGLKNMQSGIVSSVCSSSISGGICPKADVGSVDSDAFKNDAQTRFRAVAESYIRADIDVTKQFMNRIGLGAFERAAKDGRAVSDGDVFVQAIAGRASSTLVQNQALQSSIFMKTMTPLMAFFEAMMYIAAPFAAFLVTLGIGGIGLIGKYLVFATWIQLWKPVAASIELYIEMAATGAMASLDKYGALDAGALGTISMDPEMYSTISHWLGTGSMLLAATPAITLMLIYGSAVTASSLAGRVDAASTADAGVDTLDGKAEVGGFKGQLTPTADTSIGYQANASDAQGTFDLQSVYSNAMTQSAAKEQSYMQQASEKIGEGSEAMVQGLTGYANQIGAITSSGSNNQTLASVSEEAASRLVSSNAISDSQAAETAMAIQLGIGASAGDSSAIDKTEDLLKKNGVNTSGWSMAQKASAAAKLAVRGDVTGKQGYAEIAREVTEQGNQQVAGVSQAIQQNSSAFEEERSSFNEAYQSNENFSRAEKSFAQAEKATSRATSLRETRQATQTAMDSMGSRYKVAGSDLMAALNNNDTKAAIGSYINDRMKDPNKNEAVWEGVDGSTAGIMRLFQNAGREGDIETLNTVGAMTGLIDPAGIDMSRDSAGSATLVDETADATSESVDDTFKGMSDALPASETLRPAEQARFEQMFGEGSEEILNKTYGSDFDTVANNAIDAQIENNGIDRRLLGEDFDKISPEQKMARVQSVASQEQDRSNYASEAFQFVEYLNSDAGEEMLSSATNNALGATAVGAGIGAMIAKRIGSSVAGGAVRGGKVGMLAGLAVGGYQAYNDFQDYQTEKMFNERGLNLATASEYDLNSMDAMGSDGDRMREYLNSTMTSVAGSEYNARIEAQSRGEDFDAEGFRESLSPFEQQVYDNFGTLSESSQTQGFRDGLAQRAQATNMFRGRSDTGLGNFGWGGAVRSVAQIDSALTGAGEKYGQFLKDNNISSIETSEQEQAFYNELNVPERRVYAARAELGEAGYGSQVQNDSFFQWRDNPELVQNYRANNSTLAENFGAERPDEDRISNAFIEIPDTEGRSTSYIPSIESVGKAGVDFEFQSAVSGQVENKSYSVADRLSGESGTSVDNSRLGEMQNALEVGAPSLVPRGGVVTPEYVQEVDQTLQNLESMFISGKQQNGDGYTPEQFAANTPMNELESEVWENRETLMGSGFGGGMASNR